jgi:hypothetical protein
VAIILEGFDNSGKSTLAEQFGLPVVHPGPRPKTWEEEIICMDNQLADARLPIVMDRITCISSRVYKQKNAQEYYDYLQQMVDTKCCVIIYCRPPTHTILDMSRHSTKTYDTKEHLKDLHRNANLYIGAYDKLFSSVPHLAYNYTKPDESVINQALDMQFNVGFWKSWRAGHAK